MTDHSPQEDPAAATQPSGLAGETSPAEPPRYPRADSEDAPTESAGRPRWLTVAAIVGVVLLLALMMALHLSGAVGPGSH
jgi:hypothetical protein